jgi:hypothetical protein
MFREKMLCKCLKGRKLKKYIWAYKNSQPEIIWLGVILVAIYQQ